MKKNNTKNYTNSFQLQRLRLILNNSSSFTNFYKNTSFLFTSYLIQVIFILAPISLSAKSQVLFITKSLLPLYKLKDLFKLRYTLS